MTPVEIAGYKIGQRFKYIGNKSFEKGSIIELTHDDNSVSPFFMLISENCRLNRLSSPVYIKNVKPLEEIKVENKYTAVITNKETSVSEYKNIAYWEFGDRFITLNKLDGGVAIIPNDSFSSIDISLGE